MAAGATARRAKRVVVVALIVLAIIVLVSLNFVVGCSSSSSGEGDRLTTTSR